MLRQQHKTKRELYTIIYMILWSTETEIVYIVALPDIV